MKYSLLNVVETPIRNSCQEIGGIRGSERAEKIFSIRVQGI